MAFRSGTPRLPVALALSVSAIAARSAPAQPAPADWLDHRPVLRIGGDTAAGSGGLGAVVGATRFSTGTIAVLDRASAAILFFDSAGRFLRRSGRAGDGPGEFRNLLWGQQCAPDTLFTADGRGVLTRWDRDGRYLGEQRFRSLPWRISCNRAGLMAFLAYPEGVGISAADAPVHYSRLYIRDLPGDSLRLAGPVPAGRNRPMSPLTTIAAAPDALYLGTGDSLAVSVLDRAGRPRAVVRLTGARRPSTERHYQRAIERQVAPLGTAAERERFTAMLLAIPRPRLLPAYRAVHADPHGNLWVIRSPYGDGQTVIEVHSPAGARLAAAQLAEEADLLEIGPDHVLASWEDAAGRPVVALFRFRLPARPP